MHLKKVFLGTFLALMVSGNVNAQVAAPVKQQQVAPAKPAATNAPKNSAQTNAPKPPPIQADMIKKGVIEKKVTAGQVQSVSGK
jgi:hypothetical protein